MSKNCRICLVKLTTENCPPSFLIREFTICRNCDRQDVKDRYKKYRIEIISKLGNKCSCCGIMEPKLLSIDHIYGNGHQESKKCRGKQFIKKLYYMPVTDLLSNFQCLCFNCNYTKGFWNICPHNICDEFIDDPSLISNRGIKHTHLSPEDHKERNLDIRRIGKIKHKLEMIAAYGGKCMECGIEHPLFLTLDHINNNGALENERGVGFYQYLKQTGYPGKGTQLQLLCHNCNARKEYQNNRLLKIENISKTKEIYIKQSYQISKEDDDRLWFEARKLFLQILAGVNAKKASLLDGSI